jgi:hypothetical protein
MWLTAEQLLYYILTETLTPTNHEPMKQLPFEAIQFWG